MLFSRTGLASLKGKPLVAAITSVCSSGFLLFGYDQGVMSGVVISTYFLEQMGNPSTLMVGTITALYDIGAFFGAIAAAFLAEPLGRKRTLVLGSIILIIGTVLMGSAFSRAQFMVARILTGIGVGFCTSVTPVYQSEISKASHRGWLVCCQTTTMLFGIMISYWINYGFYFHDSGIQWRFPLLFQLIFAVYIVIVTPFLPDTPRWLMRHEGSPDNGMLVLSKLRNKPTNDSDVREEGQEILEAIQIESQEEGTWMDLFKSGGIQANKRFYLALGIQWMQQMSGINIVTYYAPTLFKSSLGFSSEMALFIGCWLQVWYILASFIPWYTIDKFGRRLSFISMALGMCLVLVLEAIFVAIGGTGPGVAAVVMVFLFEACFTIGWMGAVWVYPPEILPLKIRAKGSALAAAADFLGNFLVVEVTPPSIANIGYKTYIIWAVLNIVNAIIVWLFYPETAGFPLEFIDTLFTEKSALENEAAKSGLGKLQWSVVRKADSELKRMKRTGAAWEGGVAEHGELDESSGKSHSSTEHVDKV